MLNSNFVIVGVIFVTIGTIGYLIETVKGKIRPNRVSFFMWSVAPLIAFAAQIGQGVGIQSLFTLMVGILPLTIFIATFVNKKAVWGLTKFDFICGVLSAVGLTLWLITKVGNIAIFFSILADGLASIPTITKSFKHPETERAWPWLVSDLGGLVTILTIKKWNFATAGFPLYYFICTLAIYILIRFEIGKKFSTKK
jgi:hypothetical protein